MCNILWQSLMVKKRYQHNLILLCVHVHCYCICGSLYLYTKTTLKSELSKHSVYTEHKSFHQTHLSARICLSSQSLLWQKYSFNAILFVAMHPSPTKYASFILCVVFFFFGFEKGRIIQTCQVLSTSEKFTHKIVCWSNRRQE